MKRFLSIILALAMTLTLIPAVSANGEAETDGITIEYSFLKADYDANVIGLTALTYSNSGGRMSYDSTNGTGTIVYWGDNKNTSYLNLKASNNPYMAYKIRIPKPGNYTVTFDYYRSKSASSIADIYILPCADVPDVSSVSADPVFSGIDFNSETGKNYPDEAEGDLLAKVAGEYYLIFKKTGGSGTPVRLNALTLSQGKGNLSTLIYADVALSKTELDAGVSEETEINLSNVYMSNGNSATEADIAKITYKSSDESVAVIENGVVKAVGAGTANIHAMDGEYSLGDAKVTVNDSRLSGVKIEYSFVKEDYSELGKAAEIKYHNSKGKLYYYDSTSTNSNPTSWSKGYALFNTAALEQYHVMKMKIPEAGLYKVSLQHFNSVSTDVYILPLNSDVSEVIASAHYKPLLSVNNSDDDILKSSKTEIFNASVAGEYLLVFAAEKEKGAFRPAKLTLDGNGTETPLIYADISLNETTLEVNGTTTLAKGNAYLSNGDVTTDLTGVTYISTNTNVATLSGEKITAVAPGTTKIQALRADGYVLDEEIVAVNTPEYTEAFGKDTFKTVENVNIDPSVVVAAYAKDATLSQTETCATNNGNGTWSIETPEDIDEYTFRYWARGLETGNKRIVSLETNFTYSPEKGDANYLIAVYADDSDTENKEYFNANGQLLVGADDNTKPYMLGYGYATGWKDNGNGIKEAVYGEGVKSYKITVNGVEKSYDYGTKITCPTVEAPEGKYFLGWKKTVGGKETAELVSTEMNYTFYAWEDCVVTPAFGDAEATFTGIARKILISSFAIENGDSVVMAEFIGFDNAVERGITLDKDYAMSNKNANQFTIINDVDVATANISAYAILADGTKFIYNLK
ncbi:MAG: hypothetical protein E7441_10365 [Ruminococcaceae bacterium]|nr:hypothetical protein [Oscillospiraceae bacterium]